MTQNLSGMCNASLYPLQDWTRTIRPQEAPVFVRVFVVPSVTACFTFSCWPSHFHCIGKPCTSRVLFNYIFIAPRKYDVLHVNIINIKLSAISIFGHILKRQRSCFQQFGSFEKRTFVLAILSKIIWVTQLPYLWSSRIEHLSSFTWIWAAYQTWNLSQIFLYSLST